MSITLYRSNGIEITRVTGHKPHYTVTAPAKGLDRDVVYTYTEALDFAGLSGARL